jgi:hypothetical protein
MVASCSCCPPSLPMGTAMNWRTVLIVGVVSAVVLGGVGAFLDASAKWVQGGEQALDDSKWPRPYAREVYWVNDDTGARIVWDESDAVLWYWAGSGVLVLTLAGVAVLRSRKPGG